MDHEQESASPGMWAILEIFGHKRLAGLVTAPDGSAWQGGMLRIDVVAEDGKTTTQFYGDKAVFSITPTTEAVCRRLGSTIHNPPPVSRYELMLPEASPRHYPSEDDYPDPGDDPHGEEEPF